MDQMLSANPQKTPHTSPMGDSYGMSIVSNFLKKIIV